MSTTTRFYELLKTGSTLTVDELVKALHISKTQVRRCIDSQRATGFVKVENTRPARYGLTDKGLHQPKDVRAATLVDTAISLQPNSVFDLPRVNKIT